MKKLIAACIAFLTLVSVTTPAHSTEPNVTFEVLREDGSRVSDGFSKVTELFSNSSSILSDGVASFSSPSGGQRFLIDVVADPEIANSTIYGFSLEIEVSEATRIRVTLPKVSPVSIRITDDGLLVDRQRLILGGFDERSAPNIFGPPAGMPQSKATVFVNGRSISAPIYGGYLSALSRDSEGALRQPSLFSPERGLSVSGNTLEFALFEPVPQSEMDSLYQLPWYAKHFDFDGDGYSDYDLVYRFGLNDAKSTRISHQVLFSGRASISVEGRVSVKTDPVATQATTDRLGNRRFSVSGQLIALSPAHLRLNSRVGAYVLSEETLPFSSKPVPRLISVGSGEADQEGKYSFEISIPERTKLLSPNFFLQTNLGYGSGDLYLPTFSKVTVSQKTLAEFSGSKTNLTDQQKAQVKAAVDSAPNATKFICTGIRYFDQPMSVNIMVRKRAKAACEYAKELNPALSTWFQNKPTQARSYAGKVLLTVKSTSR